MTKSDFFWSMKDAGIFLGREKKTEGFFGVAKKKNRGIFWGMLKKVVIFFGYTNSEVVIFLGIKYEPLSPHPIPPHN